MKKYLRCRSCGFVAEESGVRDVCPACGVPRKMMEPFTENLSEKRRKILDLHLHPIIIHLPQAYAMTLIAGIAMAWAIPAWRPGLAETVRVIALSLPLVLIAALLSGLYDGKTRFRKVTTPVLKLKIAWGLSFLGFALILAGIVEGMDWPAAPSLAAAGAASLGCVACSVVQGRLGTSLLNAKFPG